MPRDERRLGECFFFVLPVQTRSWQWVQGLPAFVCTWTSALRSGRVWKANLKIDSVYSVVFKEAAGICSSRRTQLVKTENANWRENRLMESYFPPSINTTGEKGVTTSGGMAEKTGSTLFEPESEQRQRYETTRARCGDG